MTNSVTISAPSTGAVGHAIAISGTVSPANDTVSVCLAQQNTTLPTGPFVAATTASGAFATAIAPVSGGTWYAWAWDQTTGLFAVSSAIIIPGQAASTVDAVPIDKSQADELFQGPAGPPLAISTLPSVTGMSTTDAFGISADSTNSQITLANLLQVISIYAGTYSGNLLLIF